ncbi:MAG TPA: hemerythrin domain-containing protein [Pirellulaceae bacterium]|jgi:iron-sulfur cluster repair protein YtfE (RIC family)
MRDFQENRCYVDHLVAEHSRVHKMLKQTRAAIVRSVQPESVRPDKRPTFAGIGAALRRLKAELAAHFREEESGGCLDEAVSLCPSLSGDEHRIEGEHAEILAGIDGLIGNCQQLPATPQNQHAIQQTFDELYQRLLTHETAENQLMSQAFGTVANGADNAQPALIHDV